MPGPRAPWRRLPTLLTVTALRGYNAEFRKLVPIIESRPGLERLPVGTPAILLEAIGATPPRDPSHFDVQLKRSVRADDGARQIHRALFDIMRANEDGVRADLDTEFLHDYRVAVRRTRCLLGQLREVFPDEKVAHFRSEFRWLARATAPPAISTCCCSSSARCAKPGTDVESLSVFVRGRQRRAHRALVRQLNSDRYRSLLAEWRDLLRDGPTVIPEPARAALPLFDVSSPRIRRLYRRMIEHASVIDADTPANALHEIRLDAKKLRYLIDATRSLYPRRQVDRIIRSLKKVQSVLGDFNDARVQEQHLLDCGRALAKGRGAESGVQDLVARLAQQAHSRSVSLREPILREFEHFCEGDLSSQVRRLFGSAALAEASH